MKAKDKMLSPRRIQQQCYEIINVKICMKQNFVVCLAKNITDRLYVERLKPSLRLKKEFTHAKSNMSNRRKILFYLDNARLLK